MKTFGLWLGGLNLVLCSWAYPYWEYEGQFNVTKISSYECEFVFEQKDYQTKLFLMGPSQRTVVIHFRDHEEMGFLHGHSLVGLLGYMSDFRVEKEVLTADYRVVLLGEGLVNAELLYMQLGAKVFAHDDSGEPICTTVGEFTGTFY